MCVCAKDIVWRVFFLGHWAVDHRVCCVSWITRRKLNDVAPALWRKAMLGWLQNSLNRISQKKLWLLSSSLLEKSCVKGTWEGVSFWADARTVCSGFCGSPYLQWRLSDPVTSSKSVLCGAAVQDSRHYNTRKAPVNNAERRGFYPRWRLF